jgi:rubrerythrin
VFTRLSDIRTSGPADRTLQNLLSLLNSKLELSAKLPILAYEAESEGHAGCAMVFHSIALSEEAQIFELFGALREQLDGTLATQPAAASDREPAAGASFS